MYIKYENIIKTKLVNIMHYMLEINLLINIFKLNICEEVKLF